MFEKDALIYIQAFADRAAVSITASSWSNIESSIEMMIKSAFLLFYGELTCNALSHVFSGSIYYFLRSSGLTRLLPWLYHVVSQNKQKKKSEHSTAQRVVTYIQDSGFPVHLGLAW